MHSHQKSSPSFENHMSTSVKFNDYHSITPFKFTEKSNQNFCNLNSNDIFDRLDRLPLKRTIRIIKNNKAPNYFINPTEQSNIYLLFSNKFHKFPAVKSNLKKMSDVNSHCSLQRDSSYINHSKNIAKSELLQDQPSISTNCKNIKSNSISHAQKKSKQFIHLPLPKLNLQTLPNDNLTTKLMVSSSSENKFSFIKNLGKRGSWATIMENIRQGQLQSVNLNSLLKNDDEQLKRNVIKSYISKTLEGVNGNCSKKASHISYIARDGILGLDNYSLFGVFDGHGIHGHLISNAARKKILDHFISYSSYHFSAISVFTDAEIYQKITENSYEMIKSAFLAINHELNKFDYYHGISGTSVILLFIIGEKLICANLGDSKAVLSLQRKINKREYSEGISCSTEHTPLNENEMKRILSSGGLVRRNDKGEYLIYGPNWTGVGMKTSRSLGDSTMTLYGITCEPEICEYDIANEITGVLLATKGMWKEITVCDVSQIIARYHKGNQINTAMEMLLKQRKTIEEEITVVMVFLSGVCKVI